MGKSIISGVGARWGYIIPLDSADGLPSINTSTAVPAQGTIVQGIKSASFNDPEPQRITHYGNDRPFAQDSLPATDVGSFAIVTAKSNMVLDAMVEGNKVRAVDSINFRAGNTDKRGSEPQVTFMIYRQALDTTKGSATFGKLRQWHMKIYPSCRIAPSSEAFEQGATDKTYNATPTPFSYTPWNEAMNETNWGNTEGEFIDGMTDYQPVFNWWLGNGTITAFQLTHAPFSSSHLHVWQDGTLVTPSAVATGANPAFTLSAAATNAKKLVALIETNSAI